MSTITQKELEHHFDRTLKEAEKVCMIADNEKKSLLLGNKAYQFIFKRTSRSRKITLPSVLTMRLIKLCPLRACA